MKNHTEIKTFEDACKVLQLDSKKVLPDFSLYPKADQESMIAHAKLVLIAKALNIVENDGKEWFPNWDNWDETKYTPWFDMDKEGSPGFRYHDCGIWSTTSSVGSRLCFISREIAKYAGNQFLEVYKAYFEK